MSLTIRFGEPAEAELTEAIRWYESRRSGLGLELWGVVRAAQSRLREQPEAGPPLLHLNEMEIRRWLLPKFPYQLVYYLRRGEIIVVAFAHTSRRPNYWRSRS